MVFFMGNMIGVLAVGPLSDWFGRKMAFMTMLTLWMIFGVAGHFATDPYLWLIIRFFCGATSLAFNTAVSVYRIELVSGKWRSAVTHIGEGFWHLGHMSLGLLAWGVPNMKTLELCIGLSAAPFMVLWFLLPESPRWLLSKGKGEDAKRVLRTACRINRRSSQDLDEFIQASLDAQDKTKKVKTAHMHQLFINPGVRRNTLIIFVCWMAFSMGFFGLAYNTPSFDANLYLVFVIPALICFPLVPIQPYLDNSLGRKKILSCALMTGGVILLLTLAFPRGQGASSWPIIVACWMGQTACGMAFSVGYVYTNELFPTTHRTLALSLSSAGARVGSVSSPLIAMLDVVHPIAPLVVYGVIVLTAGMLSIWLWPETKDIRIMQTMEEAELLATSANPWTRWTGKLGFGRRTPVRHRSIRKGENPFSAKKPAAKTGSKLEMEPI